ncbi:MAG: hypothetical protein IPP74_15255 [Alphaproteobacteria bacterium]|nr:hypothetical protein [Alphaproteobacteria bacterium]
MLRILYVCAERAWRSQREPSASQRKQIEMEIITYINHQHMTETLILNKVYKVTVPSGQALNSGEYSVKCEGIGAAFYMISLFNEMYFTDLKCVREITYLQPEGAISRYTIPGRVVADGIVFGLPVEPAIKYVLGKYYTGVYTMCGMVHTAVFRCMEFNANTVKVQYGKQVLIIDAKNNVYSTRDKKTYSDANESRLLSSCTVPEMSIGTIAGITEYTGYPVGTVFNTDGINSGVKLAIKIISDEYPVLVEIAHGGEKFGFLHVHNSSITGADVCNIARADGTTETIYSDNGHFIYCSQLLRVS